MNGYRVRNIVAVVVLGVSAFGTIGLTGALGQSSPGYHLQAPLPMTQEETQSAIESYLTELISNGAYADFFAEDILVTMMDTGQELRGREAAHEAVQFLHEIAFDAGPESRSIVYGEGIASAELLFVGTQIGEFAGVAPTNGAVSVPYSAVWELENGLITDLRLYQLASGLEAQVIVLAEGSSS